MAEQNSRRVYRAGKDYVIGGVCAGFADYFAIDVTLLRILWLALTLINGIGGIAYIVCLVLIPKNPEHEKLPPEERTRAGNTGLYIGAGIVILGLMLTLNNMFRFFWWDFDWWFFQFPWFHWRIVWPILLILLGVWFILRSNNQSAHDDEPPNNGAKELYRIPSEKKLGGVCAGLAAYWNVDVTLVRVGWVIGTLFTAIWLGVVAYIVMLFIVPEESKQPAPAAASGRKGTAAKKTSPAAKGGDNE